MVCVTSSRATARSNFKSHFFAGSAAMALLAGATTAAIAQEAAPMETVVVSSSRITASGFSAPTPTTIVGAADIQQNAQPNVFDTLTQLPALQGSVSTQSNAGNLSLGANGLDSLNLRGLGTIRTLTLIDGQRVVPAYFTGIADISEFPQLLIQRVDVVTGGASASWGSDAVGGVVNFVTDKKFSGIKGNLQAGISNYDDYGNGLVQLAAGTDLFAGKGHIEAAAEFFHNDGVQAPFTLGGGLTNGRCCNYITGNLSYTPTTTPAGVPEITPVKYAQSTSSSAYGLITAGPLKGTAFDINGNTSPFQYGTNCVGTTCVGGDLSNTIGQTTIDNPITRSVFYTRLSYNIAPNIEIYGTYNFGNVLTRETPPQGSKTNLTIACGNAAGGANYYLPASINAACVANKITSFALGVAIGAGPAAGRFPPSRMNTIRQQRRYVIGADGAFNLFGTDWTFDAYFQHGENNTSIHLNNIFLNPNFNAAIDAVAGPGGTPVCRSTVAQANGCVPFSVFGGAAIPAASLSYMMGSGPYSLSYERQDAGGVSFNSTPFKDWAGDVAVAFGAEYREEAYHTVADPYADGVTAANPNTTAYPANPLLDNVLGNNWYAANYHHGGGNYHLSEAFAEFGVPLIDSPQLGKADFNIAGRAADYSTFGDIETWKLGVTWDTSLNGVRMRALQSRDVRAPNLSELFAAPITTNTGVINRLLPASAPTVNVQNTVIGNKNLKPETAQTTEIGVVYQPDYLPGFNLSVDYYRVGIKKQIGTLSNQNIVDLCQLYGNTSYCANFNLNGAVGTTNPNYVFVQPFNLAQTVTDGFDIESSYQFDLQDWDIPGHFVARILADHVSKYIVNPGVIGQPIAEYAGAQVTANPSASQFQAGVPLWKLYLVQSWKNDAFSFDVTERFYSDGVINPYGIVCQAPNCPVPTAQNPTYAFMNVPGYLFVDIGGGYQISDNLQAYFKVNNVGDQLPKAFASLNSDPVGRVYRVGLRFDLGD
jgi:outer membrane receptor protein involved in Fe transport